MTCETVKTVNMRYSKTVHLWIWFC